MPKQVDHEARRQLIAEALWRIAKSRGLEAVSLREVAAEAGVSMGSVQHYFRTKNQLLLFAMEYMNRQAEKRVRDRILAITEAPTPRVILRATLVEMLGMDEDSRTGLLVGIAFFIRAVAEPELAAVFREGRPELLGFFADQIRQAQDAGEIPADRNAEYEANILASIAEGLGGDAILDQHSPEQALDIVDYYLDRLFVTA